MRPYSAPFQRVAALQVKRCRLPMAQVGPACNHRCREGDDTALIVQPTLGFLLVGRGFHLTRVACIRMD
jgi:hypothetical protein